MKGINWGYIYWSVVVSLFVIVVAFIPITAFIIIQDREITTTAKVMEFCSERGYDGYREFAFFGYINWCEKTENDTMKKEYVCQDSKERMVWCP